jgi:enoyl-[acyl-carrier protein] reductase II
VSEDSSNRVCRLLGIDIPILQAPMTFIAGAVLAAAVSNAGALGMIETASEEGRRDLKKVRELTDRPVGANVALIMMRDPAVIDVLAEAGVRIVTTSAGDPGLFTDRLHDAGITVLHAVGTLRGAMKAVDAGVDGLIVDGIEGGGFKNRHGASTMVLLPLIAARVDLPLIASGGICDAQSMAAALVLGADGVQMGTRMLASVEAPVHDNFKNAIVGADDTGTTLLSNPGSPTMRVLRSRRTESPDESDRGDLASVLDLYFSGDMEASVANTGQSSARIERIQPVADIINAAWTGCLDALERGRARLGLGT